MLATPNLMKIRATVLVLLRQDSHRESKVCTDILQMT
jgi:hypothetical protein